MKRLLALFFFIAAPFCAYAFPVTFVATDDELNHALVLFDQEEIDSLAVSQAFYFGSAKQTKDRIRGLIGGLKGQKGKGAYLYGQPFDNALAGELLIEEDGSGCRPAYFAGVLYGTSDGNLKMCGADSNGPDEEIVRERITDIDATNRKRFPSGN